MNLSVVILYNSCLYTLSHRKGGILSSCIPVDSLVCSAWMSPFLIQTRLFLCPPVLWSITFATPMVPDWYGRDYPGVWFTSSCGLVSFNPAVAMISVPITTKHAGFRRGKHYWNGGIDSESWFNSCWRRCYIGWLMMERVRFNRRKWIGNADRLR